jgi:hypothetical protein
VLLIVCGERAALTSAAPQIGNRHALNVPVSGLGIVQHAGGQVGSRRILLEVHLPSGGSRERSQACACMSCVEERGLIVKRMMRGGGTQTLGVSKTSMSWRAISSCLSFIAKAEEQRPSKPYEETNSLCRRDRGHLVES